MRIALAAMSIALSALPGNTQSLDSLLPRGRETCYGGPAQSHAVLERIRITRPQRLQSYDERNTRMVRLVINFKAPKGGRMEDTATCRPDATGLTCTSTTCDNVSFRLLSDGEAARLEIGAMAPHAPWTCADAVLRTVALQGNPHSLVVRRGQGGCISDAPQDKRP